MERTMGIRFTPRLVIGATLVWLGTFWILTEIGIPHAHRLADLWPAGIILLAVAIALNGGGWVSTLFVGLVGLWLLSESLHLFRFDLWSLWPLVLVFFGARLILKGTSIPKHSVDATDRVRSVAILGTRTHKISSPDFTRADATAILGASNIDLRNARFPDGATIDLFSLAGGIHITVSPDTRVVSDVVPIMAGYEDKRSGQTPPTQTLLLRGVAIWCGVEVFSASRDEGEES